MLYCSLTSRLFGINIFYSIYQNDQIRLQKNINKHRQASCRLSVVWSHLDPLVINNNLLRWICICQFMSNLNCPNDTTCEYNLRPENASQDHKKGFRTREGVAPAECWVRNCYSNFYGYAYAHSQQMLPFVFISFFFCHSHIYYQAKLFCTTTGRYNLCHLTETGSVPE